MMKTMFVATAMALSLTMGAFADEPTEAKTEKAEAAKVETVKDRADAQLRKQFPVNTVNCVKSGTVYTEWNCFQHGMLGSF